MITSKEINSYIKEKIHLLENRLKELFIMPNNELHEFFEAAHYSLFSKGKRLRPLLIISLVDSISKSYDKAIDPACAVELVHTYSLIHDDMPCMDNDDMRRGKPSLHKKYNEWTALLCGDFFLAKAFEVLSNSKNLPDNKKIDLIKSLSKGSNENGIIKGQIMDLSLSDENNSLETIYSIHKYKTGSLFLTCAEFAYIITEPSNISIDELSNFAKQLGTAFQMFDDIQDYDENKLKEEKISCVGILGKEQAYNKAYKLYESAFKNLSFSNELVKSICDNLILKKISL